MQHRFDLLEEPWIPVIRMDGGTNDLGLRELLMDAHGIREVCDPMPTVEFGIYRLLVALTMDILEIHDTEDLADLIESKRFDPQRIDAYFTKWGDRFDLFHREYPFLQTPGMESEKDKPLSGLLPSVPSGTASNHFHHYGEERFGVCPAVAARLLTTISPFMGAGGAGLSPSVNGSPPWYVVVQGGNLFETICLNCPSVPLSPQPSGIAPPAWRNPVPMKKGRECTEASLLEGLTWRPRRIQLVPGGPGRCSVTGMDSTAVVSAMKFTAGASCRFTWQDPSVPYRTGDNGPVVMRPQEGREIWRDVGPLALLTNDDYVSANGKIRFSRPRLVDQFKALSSSGVLGKRPELRMSVYGMRIKDLKMNYQEWQRESLQLPIPLVLNGKFGRLAQEAVEKAGAVEAGIRKAVKHVYPRDGQGNKGAFDTLIAYTSTAYWSENRSRYNALLNQLADLLSKEASDSAIDECIRAWEADLRKIGMDAFERAVGDLDTDAEAIKRQVEARRVFRRSLGAIFKND